MSQDGGIVVYAPVAHLHGWDCVADKPKSMFSVFRAFAVAQPPTDPANPVGLIQPIKGGPRLTAAFYYFPPLSSLPAYRRQLDEVILTTANALRITRHVYPLFLGKNPSPGSVWFFAPKKSLEMNGSVPERSYRIVSWPVPGKIVQLDGVTGAYYVGLFEPAYPVSQDAELPWERLQDWTGWEA